MVKVEWDGKEYLARVNELDIAIIVGGPLSADEKKEDTAMAENAELENKLTALSDRLTKAEEDLSALKLLTSLQMEALEKYGVIVTNHQRIFEAHSGYQPPEPGKSATN